MSAAGPPFSFGPKSRDQYDTLHVDIQRVLSAAILRIDFSILEGLRTKADQTAAVDGGFSGSAWPKSYHNFSENEDGSADWQKSDAVDIMPYPLEWPKRNEPSREYIRKLDRILNVMVVIFEEADRLGVELRWGGQFRKVFDTPHLQRRRKGQG